MPLRFAMERFKALEDRINNPQDAVIVRLLVEGLSIEDIANLKQQNIDADDKTVALTNRQGVKWTHPVSKTCIQLMQKAMQQTKYPVYGADDTPVYVNLRNSEHVIKVSMQDYIGTESLIQDHYSVLLRTLYVRLRKLSERFDEPDLFQDNQADFHLVS
jgi:integrase